MSGIRNLLSRLGVGGFISRLFSKDDPPSPLKETGEKSISTPSPAPPSGTGRRWPDSDLEEIGGDARAHIRRWEGERLKPYLDTVGKITIGVGRNLSDRGISRDESDYLFRNDIADALDVCRDAGYWADLDAVRRCCVLSMALNVGPGFMSGWPRFHAAMAVKDYTAAAFHLKDSLWFTQVGRRGPEIVDMMKMGEWLSDEVIRAG